MAPHDKGSYFTDPPHRQRSWKVSTSAPISGTISTAALSTAAVVEELRHATRPSTLLGLDPIYRNPGVDFRNVVLSTSIATSVSTARF
jgi:hypothetical protein